MMLFKHDTFDFLIVSYRKYDIWPCFHTSHFRYRIYGLKNVYLNQYRKLYQYSDKNINISRSSVSLTLFRSITLYLNCESFFFHFWIKIKWQSRAIRTTHIYRNVGRKSFYFKRSIRSIRLSYNIFISILITNARRIWRTKTPTESITSGHVS